MVKINAITASYFLPAKIAWCDQVTVQPDDNKITVFIKGTSKALITSIPLGGQTDPISGTGDILAQKNAQKKAKKNITSEAINNNIPNLIPN